MVGAVIGRRLDAVRVGILAAALTLFALPWLAACSFGFTLPGRGFTLDPIAEVFSKGRSVESVINTLTLAAGTTVLALVLLIPTLVFLHLKAPALLKWSDALSVVPMVVPAVALVSGASIFFHAVSPSFLVSMASLVPFYVVITMPLVYRTLDTGVRALDLKTMWAASASLGASSVETLTRVILPNMRAAMISGGLLCFAMVLGEFAIAQLLLHYTFPVFTVEAGASEPRGAAALSVITVLATWVLLVLITSVANRSAAHKKDA